MGDLRKLAKLSWPDRVLLARAATMLAHTKLTLASIDLWTEDDAASAPPLAPTSESTLARAQAIARLVDIAAARVPFRIACLPRSIVLWRLLRAEGIACEMRLGARRQGGPLEAHAWVEHDGVALNEAGPELARYRPFGEAVVPTVRRRASRAEAQRAP